MVNFNPFLKMSPRMALEKFIESKSRHNFEDFGGLTSTPKREAPPPEGAKPSRSPLMGGGALLWDRAKRSRSSPLLSSPLTHPGRLGHHDALVKSVSSSGYNGAAVPLLQSPLLRLARGQGAPAGRRCSQRAVSASALPTAVSPLLVNVRGSRKGDWVARERPRGRERDRETDSSSSPAHSPPRGGDPLRGAGQCASEECVAGPPLAGIRRSKTGIDTPLCSPSPSAGGVLDGPVTSTPKRHGPRGGRLPPSQKPPPKAVNLGGKMGKCGLVNGALLGNNFGPLAEKDFDDTLENFPWVSESMDA